MANQPQWRDEDLDDILALLEKDYTQPQSAPREKPEQPEEKPEEQPEGPVLREEYIPQEPHRAGLGEQPDFDETPAKPKKHWEVIPLSVVAALEVAAIVAVVIWWQQWIL